MIRAKATSPRLNASRSSSQHDKFSRINYLPLNLQKTDIQRKNILLHTQPLAHSAHILINRDGILMLPAVDSLGLFRLGLSREKTGRLVEGLLDILRLALA